MRSFRSAARVWFFLLIQFPSFTTGQEDFTCDISTDDDCQSTQDGVCDSNLGDAPKPGCETGDCIDCNIFCNQYNYDCEGCMNTIGCFYCPGDALCYNLQFYVSLSKEQSCSEPVDWISTTDATPDRCSFSSPDVLFDDPLYDAQRWVFDMINVQPVWEQGIFGTGVRVRINDDGVDYTNTEFAGRFDADASCNNNYGPDTSGDFPNAVANHGTPVAAILAGAGNNTQCSVGVAPGAILSSCNIYNDAPGNTNRIVLATKINRMDISQNAFSIRSCREEVRHLQQQEGHDDGDNDDIDLADIRRKLQTCPFQAREEGRDSPCDVCDFASSQTADELLSSNGCQQTIIQHCRRLYEQDVDGCLDFLELFIEGTCNYDTVQDATISALRSGITNGRTGLGVVYVFTAGNANDIGDDVNFDRMKNSRFTITVGAVGKNGYHASYSTPGAAVFVTAPGGDEEFVSNHVTTVVGGTCDDVGVGTSFSSPVVAGVIALMLEANPGLGWRDVQGIIAKTSTVVSDSPFGDETLYTNGGDFTHSHLYGFGIINAEAAVNAAKSWLNFGDEKQLITASDLIDIPLVDDPLQSISSMLTITDETLQVDDATDDGTPAPVDFFVESVSVNLVVQHYSRGDLEIILTSPMGTESILHPGRRLENTQLSPTDRWKLTTVRHWGESPFGNWTLSVRDARVGDVDGCADAVYSINFGGQKFTCGLLEFTEYCTGTGINNDKFTESQLEGLLSVQDSTSSLTLGEACCACGGAGLPRDSFTDMLREWTLVVYGHIAEGDDTQSPSTVPSSSASQMPTSMPSNQPSVAASGIPTMNEPASSSGGNTERNTPTENDDEATAPVEQPSALNDIARKIGDKQSRNQFLVNIAATFTAILTIGLCLWCMLCKGERGNKGTSYKPPLVTPSEAGIA